MPKYVDDSVYTFDYTAEGKITVAAPDPQTARQIADTVLRPAGHPWLAVQNITTHDVRLAPQPGTHAQVDAATLVFRYRNMLANSQEHTPERAALKDIVTWMDRGNTAQHAINLAREKAQTVSATLKTTSPLDRGGRDYGDTMLEVFQEFLDFTNPL